MVRVPLEFAKATMRLAKPICDASGRVMAGNGSALTPSVLRVLRRLAIQSVVVADSDDVAGWEAVRPLADEVGRLADRVGAVTAGSPRAMLRDALERRLARRADRLGADADGDAPPVGATTAGAVAARPHD